jgi:hypothetical protein
MSTKDIVSTPDYLKELAERYSDLRYDPSSIKPWFAKMKRIFFQCGPAENKDACLKKTLGRQDFEEFVIISVIKEGEETGQPNFLIDEARFKRLGKENIEGFINRYQKNLREPVALSMQLFNRQQMEVIGFSYVSPEDRAELMKKL